jgi:hypothetical protein
MVLSNVACVQEESNSSLLRTNTNASNQSKSSTSWAGIFL